jgi:ABC-type transport system involved in multi-copper enzyme maturation permease subunit
MSSTTSLGLRFAGLGTQTRREASMWWSTTRWWRQALIWTVLLGSILAGMLWIFPGILAGIEGAETTTMDLPQAAAQFAELAAFLSAIGVVILGQGLLLDNERLGLTEWLLSKPLSRSALVLATFLGHASGLLVTIVLVPWSVAYLLLSVAGGQAWPLGRFLGTVALTGLFVLFHLALVLAVSAVIGNRGAVLAIPLGLLFGADMIAAWQPAVVEWLPYLVNRVAAALLVTGEVVAVGPVIATGIYTVALTAIAIAAFDRREL